MKRIMILIAAMAMATFTAQASTLQIGETVISMDTEKPADGDTNGTEAPKAN